MTSSLPEDLPQPSGQIETVDSLAARMPGFSREAVEAALESLVAAGVLTPETNEAGERVFRYTNPERYRLINVPDVKQPGPDFGRR